MLRDTAALPDDVSTLKALLSAKDSEIERLNLIIAKLQRQQFGRRAETHTTSSDQIHFAWEQPMADAVAEPSHETIDPVRRRAPKRLSLPEHLPREIHVHAIGEDGCPACGSSVRRIDEDISELLEYIPARFRVIRHVRPKLACTGCNAMIQAPAPDRPVARGKAGPGLLAQVLVSKYCDHLPLYRQSQIYAREGVELPSSTLSDWVKESSQLLQPLVAALRAHTLGGATVHADDTPVPVLSPGNGRTKTGRLWTYVRDERPAGSDTPPAVWFAYSPDRRGERPQSHLAPFRGTIHADGYAGFNRLFEDGCRVESACWAHVRRKFYELYEAQRSPLAAEILDQIQRLYHVEELIRGQPPDRRQTVRQARAGPTLDSIHHWLNTTLTQVSTKSALANAIRYALGRWPALVRYCGDGHLEIDNNAAERALRCVALGRKNYLFAGSDRGGEWAAALYSLIGTAKLNGIDPQAYLTQVLDQIGGHPINQIKALLPWNIELPPGEREAA